jgi:hypothetical protein
VSLVSPVPSAGHGQDRFGRVAGAARDNISAAADLVIVHNETSVRGRQPRAALNRAIVVAAVGAWDRFVSDACSAFEGNGDDDFWGPGSERSSPGLLYARAADRRLTRSGAVEYPFLPRLRARAATNWSGVRMLAMETLNGAEPGERSGLTFSQHLNQWVRLRHALAHGSIRYELRRAGDPAEWNPNDDVGDPYRSQWHGRLRLWESDAVGNSQLPEQQRLAGATVQSGCARGCLALVIQAVDWLITDIAQTAGRGWDAEELRLPAAWFGRELPDLFRGVTADGYRHWSLRGGPALYRRAS